MSKDSRADVEAIVKGSMEWKASEIVIRAGEVWLSIAEANTGPRRWAWQRRLRRELSLYAMRRANEAFASGYGTQARIIKEVDEIRRDDL